LEEIEKKKKIKKKRKMLLDSNFWNCENPSTYLNHERKLVSYDSSFFNSSEEYREGYMKK